MPLTKRYRFIITAGWSPSAFVNTTPASIGVALERPAGGPVQFGVHQDHVLAVLDRAERDVGAELDGARDLDDRVHALGLAEQLRIGRHRRPPVAYRLLEIVGRLHFGDDLRPAERVRFARTAHVSVGDRDEAHAFGGGQQL